MTTETNTKPGALPKGYVRLTLANNGKPVTFPAGSFAYWRSQRDDQTHVQFGTEEFGIRETPEEIDAKLVAALGAQEGGAS